MSEETMDVYCIEKADQVWILRKKRSGKTLDHGGSAEEVIDQAKLRFSGCSVSLRVVQADGSFQDLRLSASGLLE